MRRSLTRAAVCCITPVPVASPWTIEKSLYSGSVLRARLSPLLSSSTSGRWETVGFSILHSHLLSARPQHKARAGKALESAGWAQCVGPGMCSFHWRVLETPPPQSLRPPSHCQGCLWMCQAGLPRTQFRSMQPSPSGSITESSRRTEAIA